MIHILLKTYVCVCAKKKDWKGNIEISVVVGLQEAFVLFFKLFSIFQILILCMPYQRKKTVNIMKENVNRSDL